MQIHVSVSELSNLGYSRIVTTESPLPIPNIALRQVLRIWFKLRTFDNDSFFETKVQL